MPQEKSLSVPIAIVIAGVLIAGAVIFTNRSGEPSNTNTNTNDTTQAGVKTFVAVSASDHILGNPDAPIVIVEYTDLECPFCKQFHTTMEKIADVYGKNGQVAWVIRNFPLSQLHPNAPKLAEGAECVAKLAGNTAYFDFIKKVFALAPINTLFDMTKLAATAKAAGADETAFNKCLSDGTFTAKVSKEYGDAIAAGGGGTPYSVFVLKNKLSASGKQAITTLASQFPEGTITISEDSKKVGMGGALSYASVEVIIKAALQ